MLETCKVWTKKHCYYILTCVATLEPRKNLPFLVESYIELLEENDIDVSLVFAGRKGWKIEAFLDIIESKYRKYIIVTGFIEDEDLPYIYKMADCFVFPSIYEGFGMPPLEALFVGTKALASDIEVLREVLGDEAEYFCVGDKDGLKNIIKAGFVTVKSNDLVHRKRIRSDKFKWTKAANDIADGIR